MWQQLKRRGVQHDREATYSQVGALQLYCETQGKGRPLLLLHGGLATIETSFEKSRSILAKRWNTIAVEQQGHGHTADIDRPFAYEQMVEDTAALLRQKRLRMQMFLAGATAALSRWVWLRGIPIWCAKSQSLALATTPMLGAWIARKAKRC